MLELIKTYPMDFALCTVVLILIAALIVTNRWDALKKAALYAVTVAEENWGSKTGDIKYAEVVFYLKSNFKILTLFFTDKQLDELIEKSLDQMKKILTDKEQFESKKQEATIDSQDETESK